MPPITPDASGSTAQLSADTAATAGGWETGAGAADTTGGAAGVVVVVDVEVVDVVGSGTAFVLTFAKRFSPFSGTQMLPWGSSAMNAVPTTDTALLPTGRSNGVTVVPCTDAIWFVAGLSSHSRPIEEVDEPRCSVRRVEMLPPGPETMPGGASGGVAGAVGIRAWGLHKRSASTV